MESPALSPPTENDREYDSRNQYVDQQQQQKEQQQHQNYHQQQQDEEQYNHHHRQQQRQQQQQQQENIYERYEEDEAMSQLSHRVTYNNPNKSIKLRTLLTRIILISCVQL